MAVTELERKLVSKDVVIERLEEKVAKSDFVRNILFIHQSIHNVFSHI